jgi:CMP/dCMP kinase
LIFIFLAMIITIDGPAGAGKSSVARALARRLGFAFLDTGAMYRAVALAGKRKGLDWDQSGDLADLANRIDLNLEDDRIFLDGEDVSEEIRTSAVTAVTRYAADNQQVRRHLVDLQRAAAAGKNIVTEGRDQGTLAFPNAECKIFLTASPQERAQRRLRDLTAKGEPVGIEQVLAAQARRDKEDSSRALGPLVPAPDAIPISTDGLSLDQVVDKLEKIVRQKKDQKGQ